MKRYLSKADQRDIAKAHAGVIEPWEYPMHLAGLKPRTWRREENFEPGLRAAVNAVGSMSELAALLSITPQAIAQWDVIPITRVLQVERVTGVSRKTLRPDYFTTKEQAR